MLCMGEIFAFHANVMVQTRQNEFVYYIISAKLYYSYLLYSAKNDNIFLFLYDIIRKTGEEVKKCTTELKKLKM